MISPILGVAWLFGVFAVNEDLVAFQYVFAVCNSLQVTCQCLWPGNFIQKSCILVAQIDLQLFTIKVPA